MARYLPGELGELVGRQAGVITRAQILATGMTRHALQARLDSGRWQRLHNGVYAAYGGRPARQSMMWAAVLGARGGAVLSHQSAAELYGLLDGSDHRAIHVMVPRGHAVTPMARVVVHYSQRLEAARHPVLEPPRTRLEETALDLAAIAPTAMSAIGWILGPCASRLTTPDRMLLAMDARPRLRRRRTLMAALGDARAGVHSVLEHGYLYRVERPHGIPRGVRQRRIRVNGVTRYEDVRYEEYGVIVELDGRTAHPDGERLRDMHRDNASAAAGLITLRYSWTDVSQRPCAMAAELACVLRSRGWAGRPRGCGSQCVVSAQGQGGP
jgi:hypothetical protein